MQQRSYLLDSLKAAVDRAGLTALIGGAALGYHAGNAHLQNLYRSPDHFRALMEGFGPACLDVLPAINTASGALISYALVKSALNIAKHQAWDKEDLSEDRMERGYLYQVPEWPEPALQLVLGEDHRRLDGGYSHKPEWYTIPAGGLWGNIAGFGAIGTGKTASGAYPALRQFFEYQPGNSDLKIGGLVLDVKGDFVHQVAQVAKQFNRMDDVLRIRPGGDQVWNPIHAPALAPKTIATRLLAVAENLIGGSGKDSQWVLDGCYKLFQHAIGLQRLAHGYVTMKDVNNLLQDFNGAADNKGEDEGETVYRLLGKYKSAVEDRISTGKLDAAALEMFDYHSRYWTNEFAKENPKNRATYLGAATNITDPFTDPAVAKTFCPPEDKITFPGFDSCIDKGWIVALDAPAEEFGLVASVLGICLKLQFQSSALSRVARAKKDPSTNTKRPLVFICDEYQNFVTVGSQRSPEGDDNFYGLSRQSRCCSFVLTQSPVSLQRKIGEEKMRVILASMRTKIFWALTDSKDMQLAADMMSKDWTEKEGRSINENVQDAGWNPINDEMSGSSSTVAESVSFNQQLTHRVQPVLLGSLRAFEAVVYGFDGTSQVPPKRLYLKTDFVPNELADKFSDPRKIPYPVMLDWHRENQLEK